MPIITQSSKTINIFVLFSKLLNRWKFATRSYLNVKSKGTWPEKCLKLFEKCYTESLAYISIQKTNFIILDSYAIQNKFKIFLGSFKKI